MRIRQIMEADIAGFHSALDSVARESSFLRSDAAPPIDAVAAFVRQNIENRNPQLVAIEDRGQVIGWCDIVRARGRHENHGGELGMGVVSDFRGRGIGRQLLVNTVAAAEASGFLRIELSVIPTIRWRSRLTDNLVSWKKGESDSHGSRTVRRWTYCLWHVCFPRNYGRYARERLSSFDDHAAPTNGNFGVVSSP